MHYHLVIKGSSPQTMTKRQS